MIQLKLSTIFIILLFFTSCQSETKKKELELKERELAFKEKELALKKDSIYNYGKESSNSKGKQNMKSGTRIGTSGNYNFAGHSDFKTFWKDFKKAVETGDKDAVVKMTKIPFIDINSEELNKALPGTEKPLTSNTIAAFKLNYDKIFSPMAIKAINTNNYYGWDRRDELGNFGSITFKKGQYYLNDGGLLFSKISGIYKLASIPYNDGTFDSN